MIEFRALISDERRIRIHFCQRCETEQKRGELHECRPTAGWKKASSRGHIDLTREMWESVDISPVPKKKAKGKEDDERA